MSLLRVVNGVQGQPPGSVYFGGGAVCQTEPWQLVFFDDFAGTSLDESKWITYFPYTSDGSDACEYCRLADENNAAVILEENVSVGGGLCHINALAQSASWMGQSRDYTTGMLWSRQSFNEGKFEIRCKIPQGYRLWPAFWAFGGETEIDVFEGCGRDPGTLDMSLHRWWDNNNGHTLGHGQFELGSDIHHGFHTYAVEWDRMFVRFYFDGNQIWWRSRYIDPFSGSFLTACNWAPNTYAHAPYFPKSTDFVNVIAGLGITSVGSDGVCGSPHLNLPAAVPADFQIDYIRVYQRQPQSGLTNLCQNPIPIIQGTAAICTALDEVVLDLVGIHGTSVTWTVPAGVTILESSSDHCKIRCDDFQQGTLLTITATDNLNPCTQNQITVSKAIYLGAPQIDPSPQNLASGCEDFFCIDYPQVRGADGGAWAYDLFVDGVIQEETYLPYIPNEVPGGQYVYGMDCLNYLNNCVISAPWPYTGEPFCYYSPEGDFCHEVTFVASNGCGSISETIVVRDNCVVGPCDLLNPNRDLAQLISPYVHVSPVPADYEFTVTIDPEIDLGILTKVDVKDMMMFSRASVIDPTNRKMTFDCSAWPSGVYYVMITVNDQQVLTKVQIK